MSTAIKSPTHRKTMLIAGERHAFLNPEKHLPQYSSTPADLEIHDFLSNALKQEGREGCDFARLEVLYHASSFPQAFSRLTFVLYAPGNKRILISRDSQDGRWGFTAVFRRLLNHPRMGELAVGKFYLQVDFSIEPPTPVDLFRVGMGHRGERHFEIGVDGVVIHGPDKKIHVFLPGDAFVRSVMGMRQLRDYLARAYGDEYLRTSSCQRIRSHSFLASNSGWQRLYRGYPLVGELTKGKMQHAVNIAIDHIKRTQKDDGTFLYYYDPARDTEKNHELPGRDPKTNPYYNILRHSGGGLTCIYHEKYNRTNDTLEKTRLALNFLKAQTREQDYDGRQGAYIYSEKKAKLGGTALALYLAAEYQLLTADESYREWADQLAWHLVNQITASGEFIYYNVYLDQPVTQENNQDYFSFYYPGEAVCGLAKYLHLLAPSERTFYFEKLKLALHFLVEVRPQTHSEHFSVLPADSWLMNGIMELWDFEEMRDPSYAEFVLADARQMVSQMYTVLDAPYGDYAGAFFYDYGDYPYADGARLEGLLGAYELAVKMEDRELMNTLFPALKLGAWAVLHLVNTEEATYSFKRPDLALGGIRFKYTRQWFRIDTIQHVASFYAKLLPHWDAGELALSRQKRDE